MKLSLIRKAGVGLLLVSLTFGISGATWAQDSRNFDEFGDINCEDEMARLDNFAVHLESAPTSMGLIVFYGGRLFRGRLPKRDEAAVRAARLKSYLVQRRGIPAAKVIIIDGGYLEKWHAALWMIPPGASPLPAPLPGEIPIDMIKFRKGKPNPRDYNCQI